MGLTVGVLPWLIPQPHQGLCHQHSICCSDNLTSLSLSHQGILTIATRLIFINRLKDEV